MRTQFTSCPVLAATVSVLALFSSAALAQTAPDAQGNPAPTANGIPADIVVTATKRPTLLQKTPIAIGVIDSEAVKRNGIGSVQDLTGIAPSFNFAANGSQTILSVRGVSSRDTSEIGDPAVALSIDGFYFQRAIGLNATLFDIDRIEVLRGPQGTLLGRNSTGGAVNIITAKPIDKFAANIAGEVGDYGTYNTQGMINLPVTDWFKVRAAFQTRDHNGYRDNAPAKDGDDEHSKAARLVAMFTPTSRLTVTLTGEYDRMRGVGPVRQGIVPVNGADGQPDPNLKPAIPGNGHTFPQVPGGYTRADVYNARWNAEYRLDFATITYLGGYRKMDFSRNPEDDVVYDSPMRNFTFYQNEHPETFNHEIRLTSTTDGPLKYQIGAFYFRETNNLDAQNRDYPGATSLNGPFVMLAQYRYPLVLATSKAVYGQFGYHITPKLELEGGVRYTVDKKHRVGYTLSTDVGAYLADGSVDYTNTPQDSRSSSKVPTYHAGLNYQISNAHLLYAKFDTGYKAGGFTDIASYGPEKITAYEIGSKNRFFGGKLTLNLDAYWYDYKDQQVSQFIVLSNGLSAESVYDAGKSRYKGIEAEINWFPTKSDRFDAYVAYSDAVYTNFAVAGDTSNIQLAGNVPPQAPRWSTNLGYSHDFQLGFGTVTGRVQTHIESKSYFSFYNEPSETQSAYTRTDLMINYTPPRKNWSLEFYARNLEDALILTGTGPASTAIAYQYGDPRTFGARLSFDF